MQTKLAGIPTRFFKVIVGLALMTCTAQFAEGQEFKQVSPALAAKIAESGRKRVAVVDFADLQGNVTELGRYLAEELSGALVNDARGFRVIDRAHLKSILQEHKLAATGLIDPATARQLGKIAGVDTLVTGTITSAFGDTVRVMVKALDVSTAEIIGQSTADIPKTEWIQKLLGQSIVTPSAGPGTSNEATSPQPTGSSGSSASSPTFETESYRVTVGAVRRTGNSLTLTLTFESLSDDKVMLSWDGYSGTYILDENGERWNLEGRDSAGVLWFPGYGPATLLPGTKIKTKFVFAPRGQSTGTRFTLAANEGQPKAGRQVLIRGIK